MARSGSETRKKNKNLVARCNEEQFILANYLAEKAGLTRSAYILHRVLQTEKIKSVKPPPRSQQKDTAQILALLGVLTQLIKDHSEANNIPSEDPLLEAIMRDIADIASLCFEELGRKQ